MTARHIPDEPEASSVAYLSLVRRVAGRWRLGLGIFAAVAAPMTVWAIAFLPKSYEAVATLFIQDPTRGNAAYFREWMPANDASFQQALLRSRSLAQAVVDSLQPESVQELLHRSMRRDYISGVQNLVRRTLGREALVPSTEQRAVSELQSARMRFVTLASGAVEIRALAYQPQVAMDLANTYVGVLRARSRSNLRDEARAMRQFLEHLITQTKQALQEAEEAAARLGRGRGGLRSPERVSVEMAQLAQLESSLADVQASREIARMRLAALRDGTPAGTPPPSTARDERLLALEARLASLQEKYTDEHPLVRATRVELRDLQSALASGRRPSAEATARRPRAADPAAAGKQIADLELEIASLQAREELTRQRIARLSASLAALGADDTERARALRRVETQRTLLGTLTEKLGTATVQEQGDDRGLRVIDLATPPAGPTAAPARKMILLGVLLGLGLGVGVAGVLEYFNQPIETEEDILDVAGLPVLGWLPTVAGARRSKTGRSTPLCFVNGAIPDTLEVEGCRGIRTALQALHGAPALRTVMLASAGPSEGKSTVALNLGWVFWELGRRLVLIDADLRRPTLHAALACPGTPGVVDLLAGRARWEQTAQVVRDRFVLVPAGSTGAAEHTTPGVLLSADKLRPLLDDIRTRGDIVVFDSAPVLAVADNLILASLVDGVVLVVRAGHTQRRDLVRAKDAIAKAGGRILGVVLNQLSPRDTRRYYGRYGAYYALGQVDRRPWWRRYRPWRSGAKDIAP